jgi:hypothetical protein
MPLKQNPFGTNRLINMAESDNYGFIRLAEGDVHTKLEPPKQEDLLAEQS